MDKQIKYPFEIRYLSEEEGVLLRSAFTRSLAFALLPSANVYANVKIGRIHT